MSKELLPRGTRVKLPDGRIGIIDDNDAEVTEVFEDINYYICPIEFTNEEIWSNNYIMLRREEFSVEENTHKYLMEIYRYFSGYEPFVVEAKSKTDALIVAKEYAEKHIIWGGNYNIKDIRCVKKIKE